MLSDAFLISFIGFAAPEFPLGSFLQCQYFVKVLFLFINILSEITDPPFLVLLYLNALLYNCYLKFSAIYVTVFIVLSLVSGNFLLSFCAPILPWLFMVFNGS